ncbi:MAG: SMC-Scp complex subunit ScpB [Candidatus Margulisiibacteriota bacterium]
MESALDFARVKRILESLLFVTRNPLTLEELERLTEVDQQTLGSALAELDAEYNGNRGLKVLKVANGYLFGTAEENAEYVDRLSHLKIETTLTPQSLETLAIIAYRQPVTKPELELIRGVYCDGVLETLIGKGLIAEEGRSNQVGRPILYGTTEEFLKHFGLKDLNDLPPLPAEMAAQESLFKTALHEQH